MSRTMIKHEKVQAVSEAKSIVISPLLPRWLRPEAAADYCGISRARLYEEMTANRVMSYRVGGCRLLDREELDRFVASHPVMPTATEE